MLLCPIRSIYRWRGDIKERTEGRVSLHTRRDRVAEIIALAKQEHPYEVPGISTHTITDGNPDYQAWSAQETAPTANPIKQRGYRPQTARPARKSTGPPECGALTPSSSPRQGAGLSQRAAPQPKPPPRQGK